MKFNFWPVLALLMLAVFSDVAQAAPPCVYGQYTLTPQGGNLAKFQMTLHIIDKSENETCQSGYVNADYQVTGTVGGGSVTASHQQGYYFPGTPQSISIEADDIAYGSNWTFGVTVYMRPGSCAQDFAFAQCIYTVHVPASGPASIQQSGITLVWQVQTYDVGQPIIQVTGDAAGTDACNDQGSGQDVNDQGQVTGNPPDTGTGTGGSFGLNDLIAALKGLFFPDQQHVDALKTAASGLVSAGPWGEANGIRNAIGSGGSYGAMGLPYQTAVAVPCVGTVTGQSCGSMLIDLPGHDYTLPDPATAFSTDPNAPPQVATPGGGGWQFPTSLIGWIRWMGHFVACGIWVKILIGFIGWIKGRINV